MQGPFETAEDLLTAYKEGELVRCVAKDWKDPDYDALWSRTDRRTKYAMSTQTRSLTLSFTTGLVLELNELRLEVSILQDRDSRLKSTVKVLPAH